MPKSRVRKKDNYKPPTNASGKAVRKEPARWPLPTMLTLFGIGLVWIIVFYLTSGSYPIEALGNWNLIVGFVFFGGGFVAATQWR